MTEKRAVPRIEPQQRLSAKVKTSLPARILDISSRGAQIELVNSLRPQVSCDLRIQLGDGEFIVRATVRRCRAWGFGLDDKDQRVLLYRAGLEFDEVAPEALARLSSNVLFQTEPAAPKPDKVGEPEPLYAAESHQAKPRHAPRREGPVKIRINAEHVRKILGTPSKD